MYVVRIGALNSKFLEWKRAEFQRNVRREFTSQPILHFRQKLIR